MPPALATSPRRTSVDAGVVKCSNSFVIWNVVKASGNSQQPCLGRNGGKKDLHLEKEISSRSNCKNKY